MINNTEDKSQYDHTSNELMTLSFESLKDITGNFAEEHKLGSGTFGEVYKGTLKDGNVIAVKILRQKPETDDKQFENELQILKKLKHQNIVQLVGFCNEKQGEFPIHGALCLEFVCNGSLRKFRSEKSTLFDWDMRFKTIKGICEGVGYIHKEEIMHLDLKPDNILLDKEMVPKIVDFGTSLVGSVNSIVATTPLGTIGYVPPEFTEHNEISYKYDIFSLGIIIKEIVVDSDIADLTDKQSIKDVLENWSKRLQKIPGYALLEVERGSQQVRTCIEIAADCTKKDCLTRPTMDEIIDKLNNIEAVVAARMALKDDEQPPRNEGNSSSNLVRMAVNYSTGLVKMTANTLLVEVSLLIKETNEVREHLDLVAVLDVSGSMSRKTLISMKTAMSLVIKKLTPFHRISIVTFSNSATRRCPLRCGTESALMDLEAIVDGLNLDTRENRTNMKAGLETAMAVLNGRVHKKARNAIIFLMSSGQQNEGDARLVNPGKVSIYTFGFDEDADHQKLLTDIADKSLDGRYVTGPGGSNDHKPFFDLLRELLNVVAQEVRLTMTPQTNNVEDVGMLEVVSGGKHFTQTTDSASGVVTIRFGDVISGGRCMVHFRLKLLPSDEPEDYVVDLVLVQHSYVVQGVVENGDSQDVCITRTPAGEIIDVNMTLLPTSEEYQAKYGKAEQISHNEIRISGNVHPAEPPEHVQKEYESEKMALIYAELRQQLLGHMKSMEELYETQGQPSHPIDLATEASHGRQRHAARGDDVDAVRLFSTPRMDTYLEQELTQELPPGGGDVAARMAVLPRRKGLSPPAGQRSQGRRQEHHPPLLDDAHGSLAEKVTQLEKHFMEALFSEDNDA